MPQMRCEDFPCCGHTALDPCVSTYDPHKDPHLLCDHNTGTCEVWDAEQGEEEDEDDD